MLSLVVPATSTQGTATVYQQGADSLPKDMGEKSATASAEPDAELHIMLETRRGCHMSTSAQEELQWVALLILHDHYINF